MGDGFSFSGLHGLGGPAALARLPQNAGNQSGNLRRRTACKPTSFSALDGYTDGCPRERGMVRLRVVYIVAALNFCIDALLLAGTALLAGRALHLARLLAASVLGAAYAGACLLPQLYAWG